MAIQRTTNIPLAHTGINPIKPIVSPTQIPSNIPAPKVVKKYVPPTSSGGGDFSARTQLWVTEEAKAIYEPTMLKAKTATYAFICPPMYNPENPTEFGSVRYDLNDAEFDSWCWGTSMVQNAGTDFRRQITFIPYNQVGDSESFLSSPYLTLYNAIVSMNKEKKFALDSPWAQLIQFVQQPNGKPGGNYLPKIKQFYIMIGSLILSSNSTYDKQAKRPIETQDNFYDPQFIGKGFKPGEKLALLAISNQIWTNCKQAMNGRDKNGDYIFENPCDPNQLAVMYAWSHRNSNCPVPGVKSTSTIDGMSGTVAGPAYTPNGQIMAKTVTMPAGYVEDGKPTAKYFDKIPMHVSDTLNYMSDEDQIKELAKAFCDAKAIFDIAFARTNYEEILNTPEIDSIFGSVPQKFIYDSSIFESHPVSTPVQKPQAVQQAPMPKITPDQMYQQQTQTVTYPTTQTISQPVQPQQSIYAIPAQQHATPTEVNVPPNNLQGYPRPMDVAEVYDNGEGFACDQQGNLWLDNNGQPQTTEALLIKLDGQDWNP